MISVHVVFKEYDYPPLYYHYPFLWVSMWIHLQFVNSEKLF